MKLELDKRIDSLSDIFNFSDVENAKQFIGQKGYFTNTIYFLKNLQSCKYGTLINVFSDGVSYNTFRRKEDGAYYEYFIPECFLKSKEKKYRPFTLEEVRKIFTIGDVVKFKRKDSKITEYEMFIGYAVYAEENNPGANHIILGLNHYSLSSFFNNYEIYMENEWRPFGVEE